MLGLAGTLLWLTMLAGPWRLATGLLEGSGHLERAERALSSGARKVARFETLAGVAEIDRSRAGLETGAPVLALARAAPAIDEALGEAAHLVAAAEHSADAAEGTLDIAENALTGPEKIVVPEDPEDPSSAARIRLDRIEEIGHTVSSVRSDIAAARRELEAVDLADLPRRLHSEVRSGISRAKEADALLRRAEAGFALLPAILGGEETRTYLLAMQNSGELRGSGGAMLRFADLQFSEGAAELLKTQSVYKIDRDRRRLDIPLPPDAWYVREIQDAQRFGNANWSPDWPLTARVTLGYRSEADRLFLKGKLPDIDGVIGVDPITMKQLLAGAGRVETAGGRPITPQKVLGTLLYKTYAQFPNPGERRTVLGEIVDRFYARVLKPQRPSELVQAMGSALVTKHMQIWMADRAEQRFVKRMDWDGGIERAPGADYLYVVQQNVGGNKLNYFDEQTHTMDVTIEGDDAEITTRVRTYNGVPLPSPRYVEGNSEGFHRPMINVYVPRVAELLGAAVTRGTRLDTAAEGASAWPAEDRPAEHMERGKKVWSVTLEIPPFQVGAVRFDYRVPDVVRSRDGRRIYRLVVQRQPKLRPETLRLRLRLPDEATGVKARGWRRAGGVLTLDRVLREDAVLEVSWRE